MDDSQKLSRESLERKFTQLGLRAFEVFYYVGKTKSFSEAARELHLSQPTVSQHVKRIESVLDTPLFLRNGGDLEFTRIGKLCYDKLKSVQAAREDLKDTLYEYFDVAQRDLTFGSSTIPGEFMLPEFLAEFRKKNAESTIDLTIDNSEEIVDAVIDGELRLGVIGYLPDDSTLDCSLLTEEKMILVVKPEQFDELNTPVEPSELSKIPYVGRKSSSGTQKVVEQELSEEELVDDQIFNPVARLETIQAVKQAVLSGMGVSFLPVSVVQNELNIGSLQKIECSISEFYRSYYLIENRFLGLTPVLSDFKHFLLDSVRKPDSHYECS